MSAAGDQAKLLAQKRLMKGDMNRNKVHLQVQNRSLADSSAMSDNEHARRGSGYGGGSAGRKM